MDEQPRLTDLIPTRVSSIAALLLLGLAVIAGLEALYCWMPQLAPLTTDGRVAAIDLDGEGSLAVWFSTMTLAAAGLVAIVVYRVRRHRTDDYYGHYRIWLWAAMCWFLLSLDETASLHEGFKEMMASITGTRILGDGSIWWVIPYFFLLGGVGTRLLVDMRRCAASTLALVTVAACYGTSVLAQVGWILPEAGARGVMLEEGAEMAGDVFLLLAMVLHARHVIFDAQGLLSQRQRLPRPIPQPATALQAVEQKPAQPSHLPAPVVADDHPVIVHPPHGVPRPAAAPAVVGPEPEPVAAGVTSPPSSESGGRKKLSKAERRQLRKRLRQMALERERKGKG